MGRSRTMNEQNERKPGRVMSLFLKFRIRLKQHGLNLSTKGRFLENYNIKKIFFCVKRSKIE